jgi:serine/threonine protein kinase
MNVQETELGGYQIVGRLAVGGMAEVYQAKAAGERGAGEPEQVVLKRLLPSFRSEAAYVRQFVEEARLTSRLRHPNLVRTFRWFKTGIDYLMVQELVVGRTLSFMQEAFAQVGRPMPPAASCYVAACLLRALDHVHRAKVVHRDVNPANVLLSIQGEVKLTDFGVAEVDGKMRGERGALRGTVSYMAPEQVMGREIDHRADLFAVGVILWELFANKRLFEGHDLELVHKVRDARIPPLKPLHPELPDLATRIVRRALFADRALRFQTAMEFHHAIELLCERNGWPKGVEAIRPLLGDG